MTIDEAIILTKEILNEQEWDYQYVFDAGSPCDCHVRVGVHFISADRISDVFYRKFSVEAKVGDPNERDYQRDLLNDLCLEFKVPKKQKVERYETGLSLLRALW